MVLHARGAKSRKKALRLFGLQLVLNLAWPPVFFAFHQIGVALSIIAAMIVVTVAMVFVIWRIRVLAALLLYPYLAWLMFAGVLNYQIMALNPHADALAPPGASTDIPL
jgi:tryptophan-rich sensory protein